jgi:(p)ppGpp synthase/HD superfamily hydrolase
MNRELIEKNVEKFISDNKNEDVGFSDLLNKHIVNIFQVRDENIVIVTSEGYVYILIHFEDCCEAVYIEDVCGELENSTGLVVRAEENKNRPENPTRDESETWTFYKLDTVKNNVTIRFCGSSNGYYSESVTTVRVLVPELILKSKLDNF